MGSRLRIFTAFSRWLQWHLPARVLFHSVTSLMRRRLVLHPLESTWACDHSDPVDFSRQDTVTVPRTALACLEVSAFCAWNVHYGWNQMPHKSPVTLGLPFREEAQSSYVKRLCGQIVPAIPDMGIKYHLTHSLVSLQMTQPQRPLLAIAWETRVSEKGPAQPRQPVELQNMIMNYFRALVSRVTY